MTDSTGSTTESSITANVNTTDADPAANVTVPALHEPPVTVGVPARSDIAPDAARFTVKAPAVDPDRDTVTTTAAPPSAPFDANTDTTGNAVSLSVIVAVAADGVPTV